MSAGSKDKNRLKAMEEALKLTDSRDRFLKKKINTQNNGKPPIKGIFTFLRNSTVLRKMPDLRYNQDAFKLI